MGKIYMTACMKGGCAKTVTTYNLAYSLQKLGKKVLTVDFDSQASLTEEKMAEVLEALQVKHSDGNASVSLKSPKAICNKYFEEMNSKQMASVVEQALVAWVEGKES